MSETRVLHVEVTGCKDCPLAIENKSNIRVCRHKDTFDYLQSRSIIGYANVDGWYYNPEGQTAPFPDWCPLLPKQENAE